MFPFELLNSEASAANLLQQVRWREGLQCPRCRSESVIKHGSYQEYQRYLCKDCDRTFNDKTGTVFAQRDGDIRSIALVVEGTPELILRPLVTKC